MREYELFKMQPEENSREMFRRFTEIINNLHSLGKLFTNEEKVRKILRSLPKAKWDPKITAIEEAHNLSLLDLDDLQGKLLTHEMSMKEMNGEPSYNIKNLALKAKDNQKSQSLEKEDSDEDDDDYNEEVVALITKTSRKILRNRKNFGNRDHNKDYKDKFRQSNSKDSKGKFVSHSSKPKVMNCFECGDTDHLIRDCPQKKKNKYSSKKDNNYKKKKDMVATTWSESEDTSDSESDLDKPIYA